MDHCRDGASPPSPIERRTLPDVPWVSLAEALTWIAFDDAILHGDLRAQVEGRQRHLWYDRYDSDGRAKAVVRVLRKNPSVRAVPGLGHFKDRQAGLDKLVKAWRRLRDDVDRGIVKVRGRLTTTYSLADAKLAIAAELTGDKLATYSQLDLSTGGIRRQPLGSPDVLWQNDPRSFDRELGSFGDDTRAADGYLLVEVERDALVRRQSSVERSPQCPAEATRKDIVPPLSEQKLRSWWDNLTEDERQKSMDGHLVPLCKKAHPKHTISRERIRALAPGRKRGPKPFRGKSSAELPRK